MAMTKKEQAVLAEAQREVKLHQLCVLLPPLEPDLPPPGSCLSQPVTLGWQFNSHRNSQRVFPAMSDTVRHKLGSHDEKSQHGWSQKGIWLYSTRELATEAMKREVIRKTLNALLDNLESEHE